MQLVFRECPSFLGKFLRSWNSTGRILGSLISARRPAAIVTIVMITLAPSGEGKGGPCSSANEEGMVIGAQLTKEKAGRFLLGRRSIHIIVLEEQPATDFLHSITRLLDLFNKQYSTIYY
jgi:hypothetical protein